MTRSAMDFIYLLTSLNGRVTVVNFAAIASLALQGDEPGRELELPRLGERSVVLHEEQERARCQDQPDQGQEA
ncbi:MAG: hypothetical protein ABWZ01_07615 [Methyloceanibacter sp.]